MCDRIRGMPTCSAGVRMVLPVTVKMLQDDTSS
jgi:hypothetical protein